MTASGPLIPDRLASGRLIDLADPPEDYDWMTEMAGPAARLNRFAGQTPDLCFSIAEHQCHGADTILAEMLAAAGLEPDQLASLVRRAKRDRDLRRLLRAALIAALAFLIHDQHETLGGDVKRPFTDLCELIAARLGLAPGGVFRQIVQAAKGHLDAGIHAQAGVPFPLPPAIRVIVHAMDERMAAEEMRRFWPDAPLPAAYRALAPIPREAWPVEGYVPVVWSWPRAQAEWITRFNRWRAALGELAGTE